MSTESLTNTRRGRKPRLNKWAAIGLIAVAGLGVGGVACTRGMIEQIALALPATPDVAILPVSTEVVDRNGQLLRPFTTDGRWRLPVTTAQVDRRFIDMLIAYEDQRFEVHHGIDWSGMGRAAVQFAMAGGHIVSGGSTLTIDATSTLSAYSGVQPSPSSGSMSRRLTEVRSSAWMASRARSRNAGTPRRSAPSSESRTADRSGV